MGGIILFCCYDLQQLLDAAGDQVQGEGLHATVRTETPVSTPVFIAVRKTFNRDY